jgi:hypothetical protein
MDLTGSIIRSGDSLHSGCRGQKMAKSHKTSGAGVGNTWKGREFVADDALKTPVTKMENAKWISQRQA